VQVAFPRENLVFEGNSTIGLERLRRGLRIENPVARRTPSAAAFARISAARGLPVPETPEQRAWVEEFALALR